MAATPEAKVKRKLDKWISENMPGVWVYKPAGGLFGNNGVGDYILQYNYTGIMIEVKADKTKDPSALQKKNLHDFKSAGGISCVLRGFEPHKLEMIKRISENRAKVLKDNEII